MNEALETRLTSLVRQVAGPMGLELVQVSLKGTGGRRVVRVDIDRPGPNGIDVGDCQRVSERLGALLEETDVMPFHYVLEVSSPGADRPLRTDDDFRRNIGRRVVVETAEPVGGLRSHAGLLLGLGNGEVLLDTGGEEPLRIPQQTLVAARQELSF